MSENSAVPNEQYAYFFLLGDFDPDEITRCLGLTPSEAWRKGGAGRYRKVLEVSRWHLKSRLPTDCEIEDHVRDVLAQLDDIPPATQPALHEMIADYQGQMQLVAYFRSHWPGLHFDKAISEGLGRYRLSVDFDFYHVYADPPNAAGT